MLGEQAVASIKHQLDVHTAPTPQFYLSDTTFYDRHTAKHTSHIIGHYRINRQGRDFAVGDMYGCFCAPRLAFDAISFDIRCDCLFCVDDLVNGGPASENVIEWLEQT
ncbi:hypothetical protein BI317_22585 [Xanthomonas hortorum pv. gardneri]|nr:hypothetical protein BI317_22585 [Xanthomonas hortorum pv. gardneri]